MCSWQGPPVLVGERALWLGCGSGLPRPGVIKWIGHLPGIGPDWTVGLELDEALPVGGIDGSWGGRDLFTCKPKHGLLVPIASIIPGSQLKHLPTGQSNIEKSQNATDLHHSGYNLPKQQVSLRQSVDSPQVTQEKEFQRPLGRQKRRIPTPPSSDCDETNLVEDTEAATLRVEEVEQEDSLKKRLRLLTDHNGVTQRMNGLYNNYALQEVVIDSLYAQRHQQFVKHGRSQSETTQAFVSSASSSNSKRDRNSTSAIFSIFRWFRKENRSDDLDTEFAPSAPPSPQLIRGLSSSCGSVDTLFSTATASSFAFVHPALYRPFGAANPPEKRILPGPETETYRNRLRQRDKIRELDKNLTLKKKYHLFGSGTLYRSADDVTGKKLFLNKSLDSLKIHEITSESKNSTLGRKKRKAPPPPVQECILSNQLESNKENTDINGKITGYTARPRHRRTVSDSAKDRKSGAYVHVKGKRKAPPPPNKIQNSINKRPENHEILGTQSLGRKKRPAPLPPLEIENRYRIEDRLCSQSFLSPEEKQKLIENIAKLQAHADRRSSLLLTPPDSPTLSNKMSHIVCNDSLKLERGVLKANKMEVQSTEAKTISPTPVSPRPWYKRNNKEKSLEKKKDKSKTDDWMPEVAIARGNVMKQDLNSCVSASSVNSSSSYRLSNIFSRFEKPEEKRKSQISMLANISELDREAAEIVQKEQDREKAIVAAHNAKYYTTEEQSIDNFNKSAEIEFGAEESTLQIEDENIPRRSGARELISLFNALGNVTKVTVNSAFFSREGPSIFTKEGIEKRFSRSSEFMKASEEKLFSENIINVNGNKEENVIEIKETYLESPGIKRRHNLVHNDVEHDDSTATSSDPESSKVVIEEIEEFDVEKPKIQALYEANKIRKHLSPNPQIPAIAEMSESISSVTTSPGSTLNPSDRSASVTPTPITSPTLMPVVSSQSMSSKNYSVWTCPRCTLENPRWRVTCEACDMWRPAVRHDVVDKLTNANMGTTIAVNEIRAGEAKKSSEVKNVLTDKMINSKLTTPDKIIDSKTDVQILEKKTKIKENVSSSAYKIERSKPMTVSGLLSSGSYKSGEQQNVDIKTAKQPESIRPSSSGYSENVRVSSKASEYITASSNLNVKVNENKTEDALTTGNLQTEETIKLEATAIKNESEVEELRKARLAFFEKSHADDKIENDKIRKENHKTKSSINQAKIDALFSIASKGSLATNEEERLKVKEILKEMKDSLPKKAKKTMPEKRANKINTNTDLVVKENGQSTSADAARLGAIRKSTALNSSPTTNNVRMLPADKRNKDKNIEIFLVKSETIIEEIKVKAKDGCKSPKVSTSVQTNGVIRKVEPSLSTINKEELKPVTGKPPTPKAVRKDFIVPVTVEEHLIKDGKVHLTVSKEPRKMSIGTFELIRPRDFATIEATKKGTELRSPAIHVYANVPSTHDEASSTVSMSSMNDSPEINQWTARFSKPKGLADFKAAVLESTAGDKMSTLAVNRLLKQLESAIAGGQHERAAALAQELAKHKVSCSVTRHQRTNDIIIVDMYVEDKLSHQGPFPLQVSPGITVVQLKAKVEREFEIPTAVQRWILGKELAVDDTATLQQLGVSTPHCPVFLYLVAPEGAQDKTVNLDMPEKPNTSSTTVVVETVTTEEAAGVTQPNTRGWYFNEEDDRYSFCESENTDHSSKNASPEPTVEAATEATQEVEVEEGDNEEVEIEELEDEAEIEEVEVEAAEGGTAGALGPRDETPSANRSATLMIGWMCAVCTLVNAPTRPGCLACAADRPADYSVPIDYEAEPAERVRFNNDLQAKQAEADEKRMNYERLMMLEKADLIPTAEPFECSVCLSACEAADGVMLRDCLHIFCRGCLAHTVQYTDDAEVKCPFRDHNYACDSTLQEREIKALVSAEVYEQHLAKSVALAENKIGNAFHCKTPDCPGWCIFEDNVNTFHCPVCDQINCLTCQAIHQGLDCKQYQEKAQQEVETNADARRTREMLEEMIQRGEALACPTCQVVLLKKWGCDWLRCSMCKTEICWVTKGPRWGPNGKGDTSGGCQCGVNGVKCHPKCNYCH